ncbi:N-acetylglucosamine-1-phosphodiester alpha-N-acetylglucosaminidase-like isoform X2 [Ostrea edulis]|uniref:N-acetylglucosamine-1-phosphodiester alpha-N-acetylglucosaminidase-like isoform X2 n=1 Tax=Ostrea edulis TaxID=37623 RepID=UPI0024AF2195|nr:N-acetylglucosamine-1-phosphodiester alpha-N-acetylglucosaminidase-like isoform X2 [Ostrea edulis]
MVTTSVWIILVQLCSLEAPTVSLGNNVCMLAKTRVCCSGYYEENDDCHECIGSSGVNCTTPCPPDWFGPQCHIRCQCSSIKCDVIYGCAEGTTESENGTVSLDINIPKYPVSDVPSSGGNKLLNFTQKHWVVIVVVVILVLLVIVCSVAAVRSRNKGKKQQTHTSYINHSLPETNDYNYQNLTPYASTEFLSVSFQSKPMDYINLHI